MKILVLSSRYAPFRIGGAERVAQTLASTVQTMGDEVVVLTTSIDGGDESRVVDGVRVRSIQLRNVYSFADGAATGALKPLWHLLDSYNIAMGEAVRRVILEERPDVVHTHVITGFSVAAWGAARATHVPVVHTLHDYYVICARSSMTRGGEPCGKQHLDCAALSVPRVAASHHVDAVVGVSQFVLDRHMAYRTFSGSAKSVIPNPCHMVDRPAERTPGDRKLRLGFLARVEVTKGIHLLLDAVEGLPAGTFRLDVAGYAEPDYLAALQARYRSADVVYHGVVPDPSRFLAGIDVLVVPSVFPETFGLSAAEAMASGIPVVVSNRGALPELVTNGETGFVFDPESPGALRGILQRIIDDRSGLDAMAARARERVAGLAPRIVADRYRMLYRSVATRA